jgi:hypothetical protein
MEISFVWMLNSRRVFLTTPQFYYVLLVHCFFGLASFGIVLSLGPTCACTRDSSIFTLPAISYRLHEAALSGIFKCIASLNLK